MHCLLLLLLHKTSVHLHYLDQVVHICSEKTRIAKQLNIGLIKHLIKLRICYAPATGRTSISIYLFRSKSKMNSHLSLYVRGIHVCTVPLPQPLSPLLPDSHIFDLHSYQLTDIATMYCCLHGGHRRRGM